MDADLLELYGVPVLLLNEQVKRDQGRFPKSIAFRVIVVQMSVFVLRTFAIVELRCTSNKPMVKAIKHLKKSDPVMAAIIKRIGPCRIEYGPPEFHSLAEAIVYQQLNGKAAVTIFNRFAALAGEPLTPAGIQKLTDAQLRSVGLSKQKSSYLRDMAERAASGQLDFSKLYQLSDAEVIEHLTQVKGVGVWTAQMFLMFTLRRPNVLPTGDFGIQMAMKRHYNKRKPPKPAQMEKIAKSWEPYRSIACWYLWRSIDTKTM